MLFNTDILNDVTLINRMVMDSLSESKQSSIDLLAIIDQRTEVCLPRNKQNPDFHIEEKDESFILQRIRRQDIIKEYANAA